MYLDVKLACYQDLLSVAHINNCFMKQTQKCFHLFGIKMDIMLVLSVIAYKNH